MQLSARITIEMQVGSITETVEVSAQAALLQSENSTVGTVIDNKRIVELPLNGRNALSLVALAPNVSFGFPAAGQSGSRQGERSRYRTLATYCDYYHRWRTHLSLGKDAPQSRRIQSPAEGKVVEIRDQP